MKRILIIICSLVAVTTLSLGQTSGDATNGQQPTARRAPDWVNNGIMYQINPRAFTKEGTLSAATAKLEHLARLGITIVYLWPVTPADDDMRQEFWSPRQKKSGLNNPRNPYRVKDYFNVDPEYGTNDDLKTFIKKAHSLGMRVLLDVVYFHCGPTALLISEHPDFIVRDTEGNPVLGQWLFPKLNFDNPKLREYLWGNLAYWVKDFDADGFRWDVADGLPLDFEEEARKRLEKIRPDIGMLSEGSRPANQLYAFDMSYGFPIYPVIRDVMDGKKPASDLAAIKIKQDSIQPKGGRFVHYIDNHDISNDDYEKRREHHWGVDGVEAALTVCFMFDGIPMLYNGQEIADKSRHSLYGNLSIDWSNAKTKEGKARFDFCRKMIRLRKEHAALSALGKSNYVANDQSEAVLSFERSDAYETLLVVVNLRKEPVTVHVQTDVAPVSKLSGKGKIVSNTQQPSFKLPRYGWFIGLKKN